jgi:hypothetical protein
MSIAETAPTATTSSNPPTARILQFKQALHDKTAAVSGWATEKAGSVREKAAERPFATAGMSAGAAFVGGLAVGLLLAGRMGALRSQALPLAGRARAMLKM